MQKKLDSGIYTFPTRGFECAEELLPVKACMAFKHDARRLLAKNLAHTRHISPPDTK